jgi:hypothetical protein
MRQIFWIIIIVVVVIFGAAWLIHRSKTHAVNSGDVHVREQAGDKGKTEAAAPTTPEEQPAETQPAPVGEAPAAGAVQGGDQAQRDVVAPPASDSITRNPPNGMIFAGTGKYQLYRQGDITWRLNTDSGQACILFATDAEWHKAKVFQHGCGGS